MRLFVSHLGVGSNCKFTSLTCRELDSGSEFTCLSCRHQVVTVKYTVSPV